MSIVPSHPVAQNIMDSSKQLFHCYSMFNLEKLNTTLLTQTLYYFHYNCLFQIYNVIFSILNTKYRENNRPYVLCQYILYNIECSRIQHTLLTIRYQFFLSKPRPFKTSLTFKQTYQLLQVIIIQFRRINYETQKLCKIITRTSRTFIIQYSCKI